MKVYEIYFKVYLLEDISLENGQSEIVKIIDNTLGKNESMLDFHLRNQYKNYCFNSFYPIEADGIYKEGCIYTIVIRTVDKILGDYFINRLPLAYTPKLRGLKAQGRVLPMKRISKLYSITPLIIKNDNGYWRQVTSSWEYEKRVNENLIKKYREFFKEDLDEDISFYEDFSFKNNKPIANEYKGKRLLGDKVNIAVAEDKQAQRLAYMSLGVGMGEMNARGYGFMGYRWI